MDVARRLQQIREEKGLSINRLALRAGLSQSFVRDIELGKKKPGIESLQFLCEALGISLRDFFHEETELNPVDLKLRQQIFRLSIGQQEKLLEFLYELGR